MADDRCAGNFDFSPPLERVLAFLGDRSTDAVTGPRRLGRVEFAEFVVDTARDSGRTVWVTSHPVEHPDVIVFHHWSEIDSNGRLIDANPDADILYGQDLCHQVPAVVRMNPRKPL